MATIDPDDLAAARSDEVNWLVGALGRLNDFKDLPQADGARHFARSAAATTSQSREGT
jgi:hypothetical protein